ncbi:MAG: transposase [Anaerolineales bacterium]|nr:transposase [Anaerolineales bacterium]
MNALSPLTAADLLQAGYWFQLGEQCFEIIAWDERQPLRLEARLDETREPASFTLLELFDPARPVRFARSRAELSSPPTAAPAPVSDAASLPAHLLQRADHIIRTVEGVQAGLARLQSQAQGIDAPLSVAEATRQACAALPTPVCLSSYYAYRQRYRAHAGDRAQIAAALRRRSYQVTRIDPNAQHFLDTLIRRFYRSNPPLRAQTVYHLAQQFWQHNQGWWLNFQQANATDRETLIDRLLDGRQPIAPLLSDLALARQLVQIKLPSRSWFFSYVSWFRTQPGEGVQTYVTRHGQAEWDANFLLFDRFAESASLPLQYIFADHYRLDVLHVDDEFREPLSRLWLTVLVDAFSRAVIGLWLDYADPSIESIQGALRHAIWPKTGLAEYGIDLPWPCFGIPQRLFLDNAWAHHSYSLEDLARALAGAGRYTQMELVFRPPYQARYGGLVERLFGNLSGQLRERLPGAVLVPHERHWHNASQGACLLYRDVVRLVHQLVVDYLHTPHRELAGLTPHEKWLAGLQLMAPVPPALTPQLERSFWRLHPGARTATRSGVAVFGLHYWDSAIAGLRGHDRQGRVRQFRLRYNPADLSRIAVFEDGVWLGDGYARELRLPDGRFEPVSLWELELAKDLVRQQAAVTAPRPHSWLIHLLETRELIAQRQAEQKLIRRKVQQLEERRRGRPPTVAAEAVITEPVTQPPALEPGPVARAEPETDPDPRTRLLASLQEVI